MYMQWGITSAALVAISTTAAACPPPQHLDRTGLSSLGNGGLKTHAPQFDNQNIVQKNEALKRHSRTCPFLPLSFYFEFHAIGRKGVLLLIDWRKAALEIHTTSHRAPEAPMTERRNVIEVASDTTHASKRESEQALLYSGERLRQRNPSLDVLHLRRRFQRQSVSTKASARRGARNAATSDRQTRRLRRRETPEATEALARQMLRKIDALRLAHNAYRAHLKGAGASAMLQQLSDGEDAVDGAGAGMPDAAERQRLAALKKDYIAWLTYSRSGELPERVFSADMDLPVAEPEHFPWVQHLTAEQQQKFPELLAAHREYKRLISRQQGKLATWLAQDDARGVRRVLSQLLHDDYKAFYRLRKLGEKAMRAAGVAKQPKAPATTPEPGATPQTETEVAKRKASMEWLQYLDAEERKRAEAMHASYNAFKRLKENPAERDAWLAADDKQGSHRALYNQLQTDYLEYARLYEKGYRKRKADLSKVSGADGEPESRDIGKKLDGDAAGACCTVIT
jgi:hypothetical protein